VDPTEQAGTTTALDKHACPACGAQAVWNPARRALVCSYCGTEAPGELDTDSGKIVEIDLVQTLRSMPDDERGWQAAKRSVQCKSCHAVSVFDPDRVAQNCEFCGSPELVDYEEIKSPIRPQSVLPFIVDQGKVRESIRAWYAARWFAPGKLKNKALVDTVHGVYLPYWTFDAAAECDWTAEAGTTHYTTQSYTDSRGNRRQRRVEHVTWRPASGTVRHFFDDQPVPGSRGVDGDLLRRIQPFPTADLVPYDTAYLSGFVVEHYQVVLVDAARQAREAMVERLRQMCIREIPGDRHRNLQLSPRFAGQTFKHILVPVWLLTYDFGRRPYQVLVNGYTGAIAGRYPKSPWKIFFLILALALVALGIVYFGR